MRKFIDIINEALNPEHAKIRLWWFKDEIRGEPSWSLKASPKEESRASIVDRGSVSWWYTDSHGLLQSNLSIYGSTTWSVDQCKRHIEKRLGLPKCDDRETVKEALDPARAGDVLKWYPREYGDEQEWELKADPLCTAPVVGSVARYGDRILWYWYDEQDQEHLSWVNSIEEGKRYVEKLAGLPECPDSDLQTTFLPHSDIDDE